MPELTNNYNLPQSLVSALSADWYTQHGHISVTGLIQPPRLRQLMLRYGDDIEEDVSDKIWMLLGSAVHDVLERADTTHSLQEERLATDVLGWIVTGKADLWEEPGIVSDYKVTSVWAGMNGVKPEWEAQTNIYGYLYRQAGFPVIYLRIVCIYRDWSKNRAKQGGGYPPCAAGVLPVTMWSDNQVEQYLQKRVRLHQEAELLSDWHLPVCTPEERWERPTTFAVMKKGRKSAVRVFEKEEDATALAHEKGKDHWIERRPGESVRCKDYCPVNKHCTFYTKNVRDT
jgi:hypothetical protein